MTNWRQVMTERAAARRCVYCARPLNEDERRALARICGRCVPWTRTRRSPELLRIAREMREAGKVDGDAMYVHAERARSGYWFLDLVMGPYALLPKRS